jgi:hypothetical protein
MNCDSPLDGLFRLNGKFQPAPPVAAAGMYMRTEFICKTSIKPTYCHHTKRADDDSFRQVMLQYTISCLATR